VSNEALAIFREQYGSKVSNEDVFFYTFAILSSPEYRERFGSDLKKLVPHIPLVVDFWQMVDVGRQLSDVQTSYESLAPFKFHIEGSINPTHQIRKMKLEINASEISIKVDNLIKLCGVPQPVLDYKVFGRSPLEWVIERYQLRVDKASGISNDPNSYEDSNAFIINLVGRVVTMTLKILEIQSGMPALEIIKPIHG
jgi:predicted helicase